MNKQTFWYKSIKFFLFIHDFDPFAIFKRTSSAEVNRHGEGGSADPPSSVLTRHKSIVDSAELRLSTERSDIRRHRVGYITRTYVIYFFIKALIVSIAQFSLLKYIYLVPRGYQPPWLSKSVIQIITKYLGNPLFALKDFSLVNYLGPISLVIVNFIFFFLYYKKYPLDMAPLRFMLNPVHELKRVDLNIKRKLADVRNSLEMYEQQRKRSLLSAYANMKSA